MEHIEKVRIYRGTILGSKRKFGTARSLVHYMDYVQAYLESKRAYFATIPKCFGRGRDHAEGCNCKGMFESFRGRSSSGLERSLDKREVGASSAPVPTN